MKRFAPMLALCCVLLACGGGGGGGAAPVVSVPFTTANYDPTGRAASVSLLDAGTASSSFGSIASMGSGSGGVVPGSGVFGLLDLILVKAGKSISARDQIAATDSQTIFCSTLGVGGSGSIFVTASDNNNSASFDAGDSASITFSNCIAGTGEPALNGSIDITVLSATLDSNQNLVAGSLGINMHNLTGSGSTLNGAVTVTISSSTVTLAYASFSSTHRGVTSTYNYSVTLNKLAVPQTVTVAGTIIIGGGTYTLSTPVGITLGATYPASGTLRVTDQTGAYVDVVAGVSTFDVNLYLVGDSVRDAQASYAWSDLAAGII